MRWALLLIFGLVLSYGNPKHIPSFAGPYRIYARRVWSESESFNTTGEHLMVRVRFTSPRPREKQFVWGSIRMTHPLNDEIKIKVRMSLWTNNQWKPNAFILNFDNACSSAIQHGKSILSVIFEPNEIKCPILPIGFREVKNQSFEAVFPHFPVIPYGRYLLDCGFVSSYNKILGAAMADIDVVPKV